MVRQLGLLRVSSAMTALPPAYSNGHHPTLSQDDSLRDALSLILRTGAPVPSPSLMGKVPWGCSPWITSANRAVVGEEEL
jgi:hypothetical protein